MSLDDLLRRVSDGEIEALHEIYNEMRVPVFAVALAIVRNQYLAEDVQQETFLKLYDRATQYKPGTNPKAWILSIARNLAYDRLRQTIRQSHEEIEDSTKADPDPALLRCELMDALGQLEETDRLIIILHVISGFKHHEIGKELGLPPVQFAGGTGAVYQSWPKIWEVKGLLQNQLPFRLKNELERQSPDTWDAIYQTLARRLADNLLHELDGLPSPEGRLLGELRDEAVRASLRMKGA